MCDFKFRFEEWRGSIKKRCQGRRENRWLCLMGVKGLALINGGGVGMVLIAWGKRIRRRGLSDIKMSKLVS